MLPKNFLDHQDKVLDTLFSKELFLFLDYDGTLTPIVDTPDQAVISEDMRAILASLAEHLTVAIVSGRATDDVRRKVSLDNVFYAGSHGFEIVCPDGHIEINAEAKAVRPIIDEIHQKLNDAVAEIDGALIENVKYTVSAHYRLVSEEKFPLFQKIVDDVLSQYSEFRKTSGKKVFEIRPRIDWHKGKAVRWILDVLAFNPEKHSVVYIGDDTTDEDAFEEIRNKGIGILVAKMARESQAHYKINSVDDVKALLQMFNKRKIG